MWQLFMSRKAWFRLDQIQSIENIPGLYAWYIHVADQNATSLAVSLSCQPQLRAQATTGFGLTYDGRISATNSVKDIQSDRKTVEAESQFLRTAASSLLPPVYIGRSVRLRDRLQQHMVALEEGLSIGAGQEGRGNGLVEVPEEKIDTDQESSAFGLRFAERLVSHGQYKLSWIRVRVFPMASDCTLEELKAVEWLLNRLCRPVLGLR